MEEKTAKLFNVSCMHAYSVVNVPMYNLLNLLVRVYGVEDGGAKQFYYYVYRYD